MQGIKIEDSNQGEHGRYLNFDLKEILLPVRNYVLDSNWRCNNVECIGQNSVQLHKLSDETSIISGDELLWIVSGIQQTIDGEFEAFRGEKIPWLLVKAIDSSYFEVWSDNLAVLETVKSNFRKVTDLYTDE